MTVSNWSLNTEVALISSLLIGVAKAHAGKSTPSTSSLRAFGRDRLSSAAPSLRWQFTLTNLSAASMGMWMPPNRHTIRAS
jgi:hypothetical protein